MPAVSGRKYHGMVEWLLEGSQPAVRYKALTDLLGRSESDPDVREARESIPLRGWAHDILGKQKPAGYWVAGKDLYRPKYTATNWMCLVLSDFGLTRKCDGVRRAADLIFREWLPDKEMENMLDGEVCIVGNTARMLVAFGYGEDPKVKKLLDWLVGNQKEDGGWHCHKSSTGTLDCWEALAAFAALPRSSWNESIRQSVERGAEFYLQRGLFREGERKYMPWFRFHYPVHYYYDILVGLDIMSRLGYGDDPRMKPALDIMLGKRQKDGSWLLDAAHPDPPSYSWGKHNLTYRVRPFTLETPGKRSKWITLKALAVMKRAGLPWAD